MTPDGTGIRFYYYQILKIHFKVLERIDKSHRPKILNCGYGKDFLLNKFLTNLRNILKILKY